ncbi:hypothetical protein CGRA01v4_12730 [Colletotrichum graminicola]|nr:hypothetical protein CGRA01v4_12730 [Colletotrichum graminicola]
MCISAPSSRCTVHADNSGKLWPAVSPIVRLTIHMHACQRLRRAWETRVNLSWWL